MEGSALMGKFYEQIHFDLIMNYINIYHSKKEKQIEHNHQITPY